MKSIIQVSVILYFSITIHLVAQTINNNSQSYNQPKSIVELFGTIKAMGNKIADKNENPVVLRGMSLFWSQWGGKFYNEKCIEWLYNDWKCTVIRAAMGIEGGGYLTNPEEELRKIFTVIDKSIELGIYVIVDWHDHKAENHTEKAIKFFELIAQKYGNEPNIIYEIYNEPLLVSWDQVVKPYSEQVINAIRKYDPDNLIVVGNPKWAQDVDIAASNPVADNNIAYSLHFYSSTHTKELRDKAVKALDSGVALFVSEFGISEASGNGNINFAETKIWMEFMEEHQLSNCNWSIVDKEETSAALNVNSSEFGGWKEEELSESGRYIRKFLREKNAPIFGQLKSSD